MAVSLAACFAAFSRALCPVNKELEANKIYLNKIALFRIETTEYYGKKHCLIVLLGLLFIFYHKKQPNNRPFEIVMKTNLRFLLTCLVVAGGISTAHAATFDDFNDGNDDGWKRYDPIPGTFSFPLESGSVAYKMECPWGSLLSPGRIGSINMNEPAHTKFHVEADLLNWTYNWGEDIGLLARIQEPVPSFFLPKGYALILRNNKSGNPGSRKLMIVKSLGWFIPPIFLTGDQGRFMVPAPDPSGDYRLRFWSSDGFLWGQIIDKSTGAAIMMSDGTTYTDRIYAAEDGAYASGRSGLIAYVHIVGYKAEGVSPTFDNFYSGADAPPPPSITCPAGVTMNANTGTCESASNSRQ